MGFFGGCCCLFRFVVVVALLMFLRLKISVCVCEWGVVLFLLFCFSLVWCNLTMTYAVILITERSV